MPPSFFSKLTRSLQRRESKEPPAPTRADTTTFTIGAVIENRYRLDGELGRGGMGIVYRAWDLAHNRQVALKIMLPNPARHAASEQFLREAQITARLQHPNIVTVYETGTFDANTPKPAPFIAMELLHGADLDNVRGLTYTRIVHLAHQICDALEYAHGQGLVHRDLKPSNVLIERRATQDLAKLVDFGLASTHAEMNAPATHVAGTVYYVAPEIIAGKPADARADLYSLGVMLYEMVTGRVPFSDFDTQAIFEQHLQATVTPPSHTRPDIPLLLESLILRLLAKDPQDRYDSAHQVKHVLAQVLAVLDRRAASGNLPRPTKPLVGRADEIAQIKTLVTTRRCVTLTGMGGIGKTQLALAAASELAAHFADGLWLVEFGAWNDPALIAPRVAATLGVSEGTHRPLIVSLTEHLREKNLLIVLDNCGHLAGACRQLSETILHACPDVTLLITSRNPLNLADETIFAVPALSPADAIQLLRARFHITPRNENGLAPVAQQLGGIPLAVELVAPHINEFLSASPLEATTPEQILTATLEWSYHLLDALTREELNRLSVFAGGFTEAAIGSRDTLHQLLQSGFLTVIASATNAPRYGWLEPIRQFTLAKLQASGKEPGARQIHRDMFFQIASEATPHLHSDMRSSWLARLDVEHLNLLTALDWTIERPQHANLAFRFGTAMWAYWFARGYWREAQERLTKILALPHTLSDASVRARTQICLGHLAIAQSDVTTAQRLLDEALAQARDLNDPDSIGFALCGLGALARAQKNAARSEQFYRDAVSAYQRADNTWETGMALYQLGSTQLERGVIEDAHTTFIQCLEKFRHSHDSIRVAHVSSRLGMIAAMRKQYATATPFFNASLDIWRAQNDSFKIANQLAHLGFAELHQANHRAAQRAFGEGVTLALAINHRQLVADCLCGIAGTLAPNQPLFAAELTGIADSLLAVPGLDTGMWASERSWVVRQIPLDSESLRTAQTTGRKKTFEQILADALGACQ